MNKYRINTTGIIDGISNLNINIAEDNNHTSNSSIAKVSYSTVEKLIDVHAENGEIVNTGSINNFTIQGPTGHTFIDNDNENKEYDQVIYIPKDKNTKGISIGSFTPNDYIVLPTYTVIFTFKITEYITESTYDYFFASVPLGVTNRNCLGDFKTDNMAYKNLTTVSGNGTTNINGSEVDYYDEVLLYNTIGQWSRIIVSVDQHNLIAYLNDQIIWNYHSNTTYDPTYLRYIKSCNWNYTGRCIESIKLYRGFWTPENQIDLED